MVQQFNTHTIFTRKKGFTFQTKQRSGSCSFNKSCLYLWFLWAFLFSAIPPTSLTDRILPKDRMQFTASAASLPENERMFGFVPWLYLPIWGNYRQAICRTLNSIFQHSVLSINHFTPSIALNFWQHFTVNKFGGYSVIIPTWKIYCFLSMKLEQKV